METYIYTVEMSGHNFFGNYVWVYNDEHQVLIRNPSDPIRLWPTTGNVYNDHDIFGFLMLVLQGTELPERDHESLNTLMGAENFFINDIHYTKDDMYEYRSADYRYSFVSDSA